MGVLFRVSAFAIVVCRHPDGRWLAVRETKGRVPAQVRLGLPATLCSRDDDDNDDDDFPRTARRGWWLPAGGVEAGETFEAAAHRETREEVSGVHCPACPSHSPFSNGRLGRSHIPHSPAPPAPRRLASA